MLAELLEKSELLSAAVPKGSEEKKEDVKPGPGSGEKEKKIPK